MGVPAGELAEDGAVEVGVDGYLLEDGLAEDDAVEDEQLARELLVDVLVPLEAVHGVVGVAEAEDARGLVEHLVDHQVHPLPQQPARVVHLVPRELDLHLLVHVHLLRLDQAAHQHVVLLDTHEVRPLHPRNTQLLQVVPEPRRLLLEAQALDLLGRQGVYIGLDELDGGLLPLELRVAVVNWFLRGIAATLT